MQRWKGERLLSAGADQTILFSLMSLFIGALCVGAIFIGVKVIHQGHVAVKVCERAREFGPYLAKHYRHDHIMPANELRRYEKTIPKEC